ncbi:MAG: GatB/YqeY domain-containing protein [Deferrisomatales bacterium]
MAGRCPMAQKIDDALKASMKARDAARTSTLRMAVAALKNREIDKRAPLEDPDVLQVLSTQVKQRRESIEQFRAGGRPDLVAKEEAELVVLGAFLPEQLGDEELVRIVGEVVAQVGAASPADLGKVMGALMPRVKGRADGKKVNEAVRAALAGGGGR